jgi:vacuolar-type H+-ATPase subunit I/STV1
MSNYFYFIGFLYVAYLLKHIYDIYRPNKQEQPINIDGIKDPYELINTVKVYSKTNQKANSMLIMGILFFVWTVMGYKSDAPEKYWFLVNIIVSVLSFLVLFALGAVIAFTSVFGDKSLPVNTQKKPEINIPLSKITYILELVIVSIILYQHFI